MPLSKPPRHPRKPTGGGGSGGDGRGRDALPAHGHLTDASGQLLGGVAQRGEEWVVVLNSRVVAATASAGLAIAMLRHTATLLGADGRRVRVDTSETLREKATQEGALSGKSLEEYLDYLEAERAELAREKAEASAKRH